MNNDKKYIHPTPIDNSVDDSDNGGKDKISDEQINSDKKKKSEDDLNKERNQGDETVGIP